MNQVNRKYTFAVIATDVVIFTVRDGALNVLLIKMKKDPFTGKWAMPGGLIKPDESLLQAAVRILVEKTGIKNVYLEQLAAFGDVRRDPFGRVVSVAYFALIPSDQLILKTTSDYNDIAWFPVDRTPPLAYDHHAMLAAASKRLREQLSYSNIAYSLLPRSFTLSQLQHVYETILGKSLDKRNFRKRVLLVDLVKPTGKQQQGGPHRPAALYTFTSRRVHDVSVL